MKKQTLIILMSGCTAVLSCNKDTTNTADIPCIPDNLSVNVIAFYPFSNGSLNDFSGYGRNLSNTTNAQPAADRNGNALCAYAFQNNTGTGEWLSSSNTAFLNGLGQFSISLWYRPEDSVRYGGKYEVLVSRDFKTPPGQNVPWALALYDCRKAVFSYCHSVWDNNITSFNNQTGLDCEHETKIRTGSWHHAVATYNSSGNQLKLYRDGVLQETISGAGCDFTAQEIGDLFLGKEYTGKLDDVILFNKSLNASEANQLYQLETCCSAP